MLYKPGKAGNNSAKSSSLPTSKKASESTLAAATGQQKQRQKKKLHKEKQHQEKHDHEKQHQERHDHEKQHHEKQHQEKHQEHNQQHYRWTRLGNILSAFGQLSWFGSHHNLASPSPSSSNDIKNDDSGEEQSQRPWLLSKRHRSRQHRQLQQHPSAAVSCQNLARQSTTSTESKDGDARDSASTTDSDNGDDDDGDGENYEAETTRQPGANRVAKWATGLAHLLADPVGVGVFAEFLRSEFSEENINFWLAVEEFRGLADSDELLVAARRIAGAHIGSDAPAGVNLDGTTERDLQNRLLQQQPLVDCRLFDAAQQKIFNLMRLDSYARFLKSTFYKDCLLCELESRPLPSLPGSSLRRSEDSLAALTERYQMSQSAGMRKSSRDFTSFAPPSNARQITVKPSTTYRSRLPSFTVAALDLHVDGGFSVC